MITSLHHHDNHEMTIHLNKAGSVHYAALRCVKCNRHVQWLSVANAEQLQSIGVKVFNRRQPMPQT
jgi:hypothetical protein